MSKYRFTAIVPVSSLTQDQILAPTDALGNGGCSDASFRGHTDGMELLFERAADSLQAAISSPISDVKRTEHRVSKVELEREAIPG